MTLHKPHQSENVRRSCVWLNCTSVKIFEREIGFYWYRNFEITDIK